jgi:predicted phage terminase large subunit-like protein
MARDAGYKAKLNAMLQHERDRLLLGNWNAREAAGGYFPRDGWRIVDLVRRKPGSVLVRGWDRAATEPGPTNPDPDWTCGVLIQMDVETNEFSILDVERFRLGPLATRKRIIATAQSDGMDVVQVVNQDPGAAGKTEVADLIRALAGFVAVPWTETGDKLTRARPLAVQQQAGNLAVPSGAAWLPDFVRELEAAGGPMPHDDQMDAASTAFNYATSNYVNPGVD